MNPEIHVVGAAIRRGNTVLAALRGPQMSLAGQWEFPGGKIEPGESGPEALVREIREELGVTISVGEPIGRSRFETRERVIVLDVYWCQIEDGSEPSATEHAELRWVELPEMLQLEWAAADVPIVALMLGG